MSDTRVITQKIFIVEFRLESKFLFIMQELWPCVTFWRASSSYKNLLIHLICMFIVWNIGPPNIVFPLTSQESSTSDGDKEILLIFPSQSIIFGFLQASNKNLCSTMNSTCDLCSDVIYEVLTHSSIKTIGKFRFLSKECNKFTYKSTFTKLHNQKTNIVSCLFIQNMIRNEYHIFFVLTNTSNPVPEISFDYLPDNVECINKSKSTILWDSKTQYDTT